MTNDAARLEGRAVPISVEAEDMDDYIHFETEADVRRHLGQSQTRKSPYDRAWDMLEAADERWARVRDIEQFEPARMTEAFYEASRELRPSTLADIYTERWPPARQASWGVAHRTASAKALAAVEDSRQVKEARSLAHKLAGSENIRAYAKAVAARVEMERAVWADAYGRAMGKEWWES